MLALVMDNKFSDDEIEGMLLSLENTNNEDGSKWNVGLHYGNNDTTYINIALDKRDRDIVHISIYTNTKFKNQIDFIDLLQCTYEGFHKYRNY
jgi:hypothetical protein